MESSAPRIQTDHESGGIVRRGGISLMGALIGGALAVVNEALAARFLGIHGYACYAFAIISARIAEILSLAGLQIGVVHFIPLFLQRREMNRVAGTILAASAFSLAASTGFIVLIWNLAPWISTTVLNQPDATPYLRRFAFAIPMLCLSDLLGHVTRGFGHAFYHVLVRNFVPPLVYCFLLTVLVTAGGDPRWIATAFAASYGLAVLIGLANIAKIAGPSLWRERPALNWRDLYFFSFPIVVHSLLYVVLGAIDLVIISALRTTEEVSIYRGALQMLAGFQLVVAAFGTGAAHVYTIQSYEKRQADLDRAYGTTTRWTSIVCVAACATLFLNRVGILALLSPEFTAGSTAMAILLIGQLIRTSAGTAPLMLVLSRHQRAETYNIMGGLALNVTLNLFLVPRYGMVGAALATATVFLVIAISQVIQVQYYLGLATIRAPLFRALAVGVVVVALGWFADRCFGWKDSGSPAVLAARIPCVGLLMALGLWSYALEPEDRVLLKTLARRDVTA